VNTQSATVIVAVLAVVISLGIILAARVNFQVDQAMPYVKVLGMYSPFLTWLKYRRLPRLKRLNVRDELGRLKTAAASAFRANFVLPRPETRPPLSPAPYSAPAPSTASDTGPASPAPLSTDDSVAGDETTILKRQLQEMQARISTLEAELTHLQQRPFDWKKKWPLLALTVAVIGLAAIPSALVVQHRWLNDERWVNYFSPGLWCKVDFLCHSALPSYFVVIFACFAGLLLLLFWQKTNLAIILDSIGQAEAPVVSKSEIGGRQAWVSRYLLAVAVIGFAWVVLRSWPQKELPGWDLILVALAYLLGWLLREVPLARVLNAWRQNFDFILAVLLSHFSLLAALASYYSAPQYLWAGLLILVLTTGNLLRYFRRIKPIFWVVSLALVLSTLHISGWWTSVVGDDYSLHDLARNLAERRSLISLGDTLFSARGDYDKVPLFASYVQAFFVRFLGHDSFGWRFGSLYLCAMGAGLFYLFLKTFVTKRVALIASVFLAASHYVMSFGKIGYTNLQALFALSLNLCVAAWAVRSKRPLAFAALGAALAFCFYSYPGALYVLPYPLLLLLFYDPPRSRAALGRWGLMLSVLGILIYPLFLQPLYWEAKGGGTIFNRPDLVQSASIVIQHFATNILYAAFSFLYAPQETHFVAASFVDPLTGALAAIGLLGLLKQSWRRRFAAFFLIGFVGMLVSAGASHDREFPPVTRMFLILPWLALFAAWGLVWIEEQLKKLELFSPRLIPTLAPVMLVAMTGLNLYQAYDLSYHRFGGNVQIEQLFMRIAQKAYQLEPDTRMNYVVILDASWSIGGLIKFQEVYPLYLEKARLSQIQVDGPALPEQSKPLLTDRNTLILILPWLDKGWQQGLEAPLRELGKEPCAIYTPAGEPRFTLYHASDLGGVCQ
jgi:hypothetical protein